MKNKVDLNVFLELFALIYRLYLQDMSRKNVK